MRSLYTSASGMIAQQMNLDIISNNLANANTYGYKRVSAHFQDLLYQTLRSPGALSNGGGQIPVGSQIGMGVSAGTTKQTFTQGTIQKSGGDYDIAIRGEGFLSVLNPATGALSFTRDGALAIDGTGRLVTSEGMVVQPEIIFPPDRQSITIATDGTVSVTRAGQNQPEAIGQIRLTRFTNNSGLLSLGGNLYQPTPASGDPVEDVPGANGLGQVIEKSVEMPNIEVVEEMIRMIVIQRAYEANSKAIQSSDEMLQGANNIKR